MTMRRLLAILLLSGCGGQPLLHDVPRPDPAVVAAAAAAVAGAATLADPQGAAKRNERETTPDLRGVKAQRMPGDVLDRLDAAERDAGAATAPPQK